MARKKKNPFLAAALSGGATALSTVITKGVENAIGAFSHPSGRPKRARASKKARSRPIRKSIVSAASSSEVYAPSGIGYSFQTAKPHITQLKDGVRIRFREYISSAVAGSEAFTVQFSENINPGNATLFPWLSIQAACWEQYKLHQFRVCFIPVSSTSTKGDVILVTEYDPAAGLPANPIQALDKVGTVSGPVWVRNEANFDQSRMFPFGGFKYIRNSYVAGDIKTYDAGQFIFCSENEENTNTIGRLFVEYDIEMRVPLVRASIISPDIASVFWTPHQDVTADATTTLTGWTAMTDINGTKFNPLELAHTSGVYTLPKGCWEMSGVVSMAASTVGACHLAVFVFSTGVSGSVNYAFTGNSTTTATYPYLTVPFKAFISSDGSTTMTVKVKATGTGTLTISSDDHVVSTLLSFKVI